MRVLNLLPQIQSSQFSSHSVAQIEMDALMASFSASTQDLRQLAPLMLGSLAGQLVQVGVGIVFTSRFASLGISALSLGVEVSAYEVTRGLQGDLSFWQNLRRDYLQFGFLRASGALLKTENIFLRHLFQDSVLVLGSEIENEGTLDRRDIFKKMLNAEVFNLSMEATSSAVHLLLGGSLLSLRRSLEVSRNIQASSREVLAPREILTSMRSEEELPHMNLTAPELRTRFRIHAVPHGEGHKVMRLPPSPAIRIAGEIRVHTPANPPRALGMMGVLNVSSECKIEIPIREGDVSRTYWVKIVSTASVPVEIPVPAPLPPRDPRLARVSPRSHPRWLGVEEQVGTAPDGIVNTGRASRMDALYAFNPSPRKSDRRR